jgi:hypothetical protein
MADTVYQLKVTMRGIRPPIWRRVRVAGGLTLARLHDALQEAFGWTNSHLHQFRVGRECFGVPDRDGWGGPEVIDERRVRLEDVADVKSRLVYEYDFGDGWEHDIVVERVDVGGEPVPTCVDGRRSRPPEDCGGPHGYDNLLLILADPKHPEHAEMREWAGPYFHAEQFDLDFTNKQLRALGTRWQRAAARKTRTPRVRSTRIPAND